MATPDEVRAQRFAEARLLESTATEKFLWWMSFVDPSLSPPPSEQRPGGPSFLGACIVEAASYAGAVLVSRDLGINPGGQAKITGPFPLGNWEPQWCNRLLSLTDIDLMPGD
jgi:hypothetical protein